MIEFVKAQRKNLKEAEDQLIALKNEKELLTPIVASNRELVGNIIRAQNQLATTNIWTERWIGAGFGVFGSLVASIIWALLRLYGAPPRLQKRGFTAKGATTMQGEAK